MKNKTNYQLNVLLRIIKGSSALTCKPLSAESGWSPKCKSSSPRKQHSIQSPFHKLIATSCKLQFSMCKFMIIVNNYTPLFVLVINPICHPCVWFNGG